VTDEEIDICPDCLNYVQDSCTIDDILEDDRIDPNKMVDECVFFEGK
jgi:hypothetical protein